MNEEKQTLEVSGWQQSTLEKILSENVKEQRSKRRWNIFFRSIYLLIFIGILVFLFFPSTDTTSAGNPYKPHTALVRIEGSIMAGGDVDSEDVEQSLTKAYKNPNVEGIVLRIDSPGGSPVQAAEIYDTIMRLRQRYPQKKIYSVCMDSCTSAAYYIASATDEIYANPSSIIGSIGVLLNGFGFVDTMQKVGVERRLMTSGNAKGFLDPFLPLRPEDVNNAQKMLDIVHEQFIEAVKKGRGTRLQISPEIFSGQAWTGFQAKDMGLIDGFGSMYSVSHDLIKNTNIVDYTKMPGFLSTLSRNVGLGFSHSVSKVGLKELGLDGNMMK